MSMMALAQQLQSQGRGNDTILAHINPAEAAMLEAAGGSGTLNPETGLPEFDFFSDLWHGVKKVWTNTVQPLVKKLAPVIIPAVSIFFPAAIPAIGAWFGATGTAAAIAGTAALSAGVTLAAGGTFEQAIKGAALGAAASYVTPILGAKANQLLGAQLSPAVQSYLGSAIVSGGIAAARGQGVRDVFKAAATGAATAYLGTLAKNYYQSINDKIATNKLNISQKTADGGLVVAADAETYKKAGLSQTQIANALRAQGVSSQHADLAAKSIVANNSAEQTALILAEYAGKSGYQVMSSGKDAIANSVTLGNNSDILLRAEDTQLLARDAVALKNQGLTQTNIQLHLEATGASRQFAINAAAGAMQGQSVDVISNNLLNQANNAAATKRADYSQGKVYDNTDYVVPREVGQVMTAEQQNLADSIPYKDMVTSGRITVDQAATYADAGYKPADVTKLMSVGYDAADLQDLAGVGVKATDLVNLSNTKFAESQINDLMAGGASVSDIANTSNLVNTGKISVDQASQLLSRDIGSTAINSLVTKGQVNTALNSTLSGQTIDRLASGGWDLNKAVALQNSGANVDQLISENKWNDYRELSNAPIPPRGTVAVKDASGRTTYYEAATGNTLDANGRVITYARAPDVSSGTQTAGPGKVDVSGIVGRVGNESSVRGSLSEGATLATQADIDAGRAVVNTEANAWEVPPLRPITPVQDTTVPSRPVTPVTVTPDTGYTYTTPPGEVVGPPAPPTEYVYTTPPGEVVGPPAPAPVAPAAPSVPVWMPPGSEVFGNQNGRPIYITPTGELYSGTGDLLGNATPPGETMGPPAPAVVTPPVVTPPVVTPSAPVVTPPGYTYTTPPGETVGPPAPVTPGVTNPTVTVPGQQDDGTILVTAPRETEPPLIPLVPTPITSTPPVTPVVIPPPPTPVVEPPAPKPPPAPVEVITPATPYVPVPTPETPADPAKPKGYGPVTPLEFGDVGKIYNPGLNPGFVQPTAFYQTFSPVQSRYYYGAHPYQPGPRFDQTLYNTVPGAPQTPFGLQQMYTPTDLNQYLSQFTAGPVAPR